MEKRRVIYMNEEDWQRIVRKADAEGVTISAYFRKLSQEDK